jgi:hypothetical protein
MKNTYKALFLSLFTFFSISNIAYAQTDNTTDIVFNKQSGPQDSVINKMFKTFLSKDPSVSFDSSVVNLDNSGVGSIIVRFQGSGVCDQNNNCVTSILSYQNNQWVSVFQHKAINISIINQTTQKNAMNPIRVETSDKQSQVWYWDGSGKYSIYLPSVGTVFHETDPVNNKLLLQVKEFLKNDYTTTNLTDKEIQISDNTIMYLVNVGGSANCGILSGCNQIGYLLLDDKYKMVFADWGSNDNVVLNTKTNGYQDIGIGNAMGYDKYSWNGNKYILSDTSYPSQITPEP